MVYKNGHKGTNEESKKLKGKSKKRKLCDLVSWWQEIKRMKI